MSDKATNAFPIIENNLTKITNDLSENVNKIGAEMEATSRTFTDSIIENTNQINKTVNDSNEKINS